MMVDMQFAVASAWFLHGFIEYGRGQWGSVLLVLGYLAHTNIDYGWLVMPFAK